MLSPWSIATGPTFLSILLRAGGNDLPVVHEVCICQSRLSDADQICAVCELHAHLVNQS